MAGRAADKQDGIRFQVSLGQRRLRAWCRAGGTLIPAKIPPKAARWERSSPLCGSHQPSKDTGQGGLSSPWGSQEPSEGTGQDGKHPRSPAFPQWFSSSIPVLPSPRASPEHHSRCRRDLERGRKQGSNCSAPAGHGMRARSLIGAPRPQPSCRVVKPRSHRRSIPLALRALKYVRNARRTAPRPRTPAQLRGKTRRGRGQTRGDPSALGGPPAPLGGLPGPQSGGRV